LSDHQKGDASGAPTNEPKENWIIRSINKIQSKREQRKSDKKNESPQDRAARRTANATVWIAGFTCVSVAIGVSQAIITNRQLSVMEKTLFHDDRANLGVLQVSLDIPPTANSSFVGRLTIINKGRTKGQIRGTGASYVFFGWSKNIPDLPTDFRADFTPCDRSITEQHPTIPAGPGMPWCFAQTKPLLSPQNIQAIKSGKDGLKLWARGILIYLDSSDFLHHTIFCRRYDVASEGFVPVDDKECNYSD
jgi:hypothetical protein